MARVRKIELDFGFEAKEGEIIPALRKIADLPKDAAVHAVYHIQDKVGVLVESAEYGNLEAGDLVYYAPVIPLKPTPEKVKDAG